MTDTIQLRGLSYQVQDFALRDLNLTVPKGAVYGFLGPNGAGKTTTIRLLLGLLRPQAGEIRVFGEAVPQDIVSILSRVGYVPERPHLYPSLTVAEAVRLHADHAEALVARGAFLARIKRHPEAEADLQRALRLAPKDAGVHFELGFALWRKGLASEAVEHLRRAAELAPERADAAYYLGESLHQIGDDLNAFAALERSAAIDPGNPKPLQLLGRVLDRLGRPEEAREMYRRAREATPR